MAIACIPDIALRSPELLIPGKEPTSRCVSLRGDDFIFPDWSTLRESDVFGRELTNDEYGRAFYSTSSINVGQWYLPYDMTTRGGLQIIFRNYGLIASYACLWMLRSSDGTKFFNFQTGSSTPAYGMRWVSEVSNTTCTLDEYLWNETECPLRSLTFAWDSSIPLRRVIMDEYAPVDNSSSLYYSAGPLTEIRFGKTTSELWGYLHSCRVLRDPTPYLGDASLAQALHNAWRRDPYSDLVPVST